MRKTLWKTLWNMALPQAVHGLAPFSLTSKRHKVKLRFFQSVVTENGQVVGGVPFVKMKTDHLGVWSERRPPAWRRGLMQPIRQVIIRICPLHTNPKRHKVCI